MGELIQAIGKVDAISPAYARRKLFVGAEMQVTPFCISKLATRASGAPGILEAVMAQVTVVIKTFNRSTGANTRTRLVTMYGHLLGTQLHIMNAFAIGAFAFADEIVIVAERVVGNLLELGLIRILCWSIGWVFGWGINSVAVRVKVYSLGHLLRLGCDVDILETLRTTGFSVADRDSSIARAKDTGSASKLRLSFCVHGGRRRSRRVCEWGSGGRRSWRHLLLRRTGR